MNEDVQILTIPIPVRQCSVIAVVCRSTAGLLNPTEGCTFN